jgi:hypothetical protein
MRTFAVTLAIALFNHAAQAGIVLEMETREGKDGAARTSSIWIDGDRMRVEAEGHVVIYRGDKGVLWLIEAGKGVFREMSAADMKNVGTLVQGALGAMQEQMKNLPPEAREMMEKMMGGKLGAAPGAAAAQPAPAPKLVRTDKTETVHGVRCRWYELEREGKREQQLCLARFEKLGFAAAAMKVAEKFAELVKSSLGPMAEKLTQGLFHKFEGEGALPGFPVRAILSGPRGEIRSDVKKIAAEAVPAEKFEVPPGLKKEAVMEGLMKGL